MDAEVPTLADIQGRVIDDFEILEKFSGGGFSQVHFARHIPTNTFCAAKIIDLSKQTKSGFTTILHEVSVFMQVHHPNISSLYRLSQVGNLLLFFMEYEANGTLSSIIRRGMKEEQIRKMFIQIFDAIRYVQANHFLAHRDIKAENVLLDSDMNVKVIDFGLSDTFYCHQMRGFVGTLGYAPPEVMAGNEYNEKCDVWCLGILLYRMTTGNLPFFVAENDLRGLVSQAEKFEPPSYCSPSLSDILRQMLNPVAMKRPTLLQLQNHPFLKGITPLPLNLSPTPIMFYKVRSFQDILKFRRAGVVINDAIVDKCVETIHCDRDRLVKDLTDGKINAETTVYFIMTKPLYTKPVVNTSKLPPLKLGKTRVSEIKSAPKNKLIKYAPAKAVIISTSHGCSAAQRERMRSALNRMHVGKTPTVPTFLL